MAAGLLMLVWALLAPSPAVGAGWLVGFLFWLAIAVGALLLLAIHALTSGRWGWIVVSSAAPGSGNNSGVLVFGLPVWLSLPGLFPWAHHREAADPGVAHAVSECSRLVGTLPHRHPGLDDARVPVVAAARITPIDRPQSASACMAWLPR